MQVSPVPSSQRNVLSMSMFDIESPVKDEKVESSKIASSFDQLSSFRANSCGALPSPHPCFTDSLLHHISVGALASRGKDLIKQRSHSRDLHTNSGRSLQAIENAINQRKTSIWSAFKDCSNTASHSLHTPFPLHLLEPTPIGPSGFALASPVHSTSTNDSSFEPPQSPSRALITDPSSQKRESHKEIRVPSPTTSSDVSKDQGESARTSPLNENNKRDLQLSAPESPKKRSKCNPTTEKSPTYRPYQEKQWTEQFQELLKFRASHGHCLIPHTCQSNSSLSRWVKRQRYQYKLKQENKASALSDERVMQLEQVGFVWDSHAVIWEERLAELKQYKLKQGDCNVPSHYGKNPKLATWVKCQRRQYRKFCNGESSSMTAERFGKLDNMGFTWKLRGLKKDSSSGLDFM